MGERGNVCVRQKPHDVYLYTHWSGYELPKIVRAALARRERWNDETYLTRIIFCEMIKDDVGGAISFGIGTQEMDNNHPIVYVDPENQTVCINGVTQEFKDFIKTT